MQTQSQDKIRLLVFTSAIGIFIAILLLLSLRSIAGAQHDPNKPPFEGVLVPAASPDTLQTGDPVGITSLDPGWRSQFNEDFESSNWEDKWDINLDGSGMGYKWGTRVFTSSEDSSSTSVGWGIGGGANGSALDPVAPAFPAGVKTWLVAGPINVANATDALVNLDLFYESDGNDPFTISVSQDRYVFTEEYRLDQVVPTGSWQPVSVSLLDYVADSSNPQVYVAFIFSSTDGSPDKIGAMMDNIEIMIEGEPYIYLPVIAYTDLPTPTPTPIPGADYSHSFTNDIVPWKVVNWSTDSTYNLYHDPGTDGSRQGFMSFSIQDKEDRAIASPLIPGPKPPYNIESTIKLRSERETGNQYSIVFGGNYDGSNCPGEPASCFNQYYEMRIRYYIDDKHRMDMKLKRIDGDGSDPDLIPWNRVKEIEEDDFLEWDISVDTNGKIIISVNDEPIGEATDTNYIDNQYFGVIIRNGSENGDAEAKFDYFNISAK